MTDKKPETTTKPYPTIDDKVSLFKDHHIDILDSYHSDGTTGKISQVIAFDGVAAAGAAEKVAKEHGIKIHEFCVTWPYTSDNEPTGECYSALAF